MKLFKCTHCGQLLFFENNRCEQCGYPVGFLTGKLELLPMIDQGNRTFKLFNEADITMYRYCANYEYGVCNWLVPENSKTPYCTACVLNRIIPNLSKQEYRQRWRTLEWGKHRLIYGLLRLQLPLVSKIENPEIGLCFDFMADDNQDSEQRILTGHDNGLITINIAEADDIEREMARKAMDEVYRTVLGHFRHEIGHYYWDRLIDNSGYLEKFRALFGDERLDYGEALKIHYQQGAPPDWNEHFISAYASTHPWEDWAETWAHYSHIIDTLETAYAFGLRVQPGIADYATNLRAELTTDPYQIESFETIINMWLPLTFALNSLNRSMGLPDPYPFIIRPKIIEKLTFIHQVSNQTRNNPG